MKQLRLAYTALSASKGRNAVPASFWRGGTSNGLMLRASDVPGWNTHLSHRDKYEDFRHGGGMKRCEELLRSFFDAAMGAPDGFGRQLNGMGGGISSLSKAVIVDRSFRSGLNSDFRLGKGERGEEGGNVGGSGRDGDLDVDADVDVDYWFVQIGIKDGLLDMGGNCGNMTSAVAPFALDASLVDDVQSRIVLDDNGRQQISRFSAKRRPEAVFESRTMKLNLRNMNTGKVIRAEFEASQPFSLDQVTEPDNGWRFEERGMYRLDGVSGKSSPITLTFLDPAGAKTGKALPTGNSIDVIRANGKEIKATLSDISNPGVFIDGRDVGWDPTRKPDEMNSDGELLTQLELIRRAGTEMMGLDPDVPSIPKIVLVYPPQDSEQDIDIRCQALSMQQPHKAVPVTLGLNLGVACKMQGTIPYQLARQRDKSNTVVGHPSGKMEVGAEIDTKSGKIIGAKLLRSARWLMDGVVNDTFDEEWEVA